MNFLFKIIGLLLTIITPLASFIVIDPTVPFDKEIGVVEEKIGGYMKGVCHAEPQYDLLKGANIGWIRDDIPFAFNKDGSLSQSYINWKAETKAYADNGLKVMAITPYPEDFIEYGLDPRVPENKQAIQDIAKFYLNDLKDIVGAFQITNEMGIDRFTLPLTLEEAADFIGMQLEAMYPDRGNIIIGYNLGGLAILQLPGLMKEYHKYCDYVGLDMYLGCFEPVLKNPNQYITILNFVRRITGKPIIMCEFGYIGLGEPKTNEEKQAILEGYGFSSEKQARENIDEFIANLLPTLQMSLTNTPMKHPNTELTRCSTVNIQTIFTESCPKASVSTDSPTHPRVRQISSHTSSRRYATLTTLSAHLFTVGKTAATAMSAVRQIAPLKQNGVLLTAKETRSPHTTL